MAEASEAQLNAELYDLGSKLDAAPKFKRPERRARRVGSQFFDEVTIRTVPRYKTSSISGNEWRFNAEGAIKYKGRLMWEGKAGSVPQMLAEMAAITQTFDFHEKDKPDTSDLCDQEGCKEPWVNVYSLEQVFCQSCCRGRDPDSDTLLVRKFCGRHAQRGDCSLEDCQSNYRVVSTDDNQVADTIPIATTDPADERPAAYGGMLTADE